MTTPPKPTQPTPESTQFLITYKLFLQGHGMTIEQEISDEITHKILILLANYYAK